MRAATAVALVLAIGIWALFAAMWVLAVQTNHLGEYLVGAGIGLPFCAAIALGRRRR